MKCLSVCAQKSPCPRGEWSELSARHNHRKQLRENYSSSDVSMKRYLQWQHRISRRNDRLYARAATKKKGVATKRVVASVGESQAEDSTPVWYLSITASRLMRPTVVIWCCYNSFYLPIAMLDLKGVHLSAEQFPGAQNAQATNFLTRNYARWWPISVQFFQSRLGSKFVIK